MLAECEISAELDATRITGQFVKHFEYICEIDKLIDTNSGCLVWISVIDVDN